MYSVMNTDPETPGQEYSVDKGGSMGQKRECLFFFGIRILTEIHSVLYLKISQKLSHPSVDECTGPACREC